MALFELIDGRAKQSLQIFRYYNCQLNECSKDFVVILGVSLGLIMISLTIIIPYVVSVNNINNRVLSLFGIIPLFEIESLMKNCSKYLETHLVEAEPIDFELKHIALPNNDEIMGPNSPPAVASPLSPTSPASPHK